MRKVVFATLGILALASAVAAQSNAVQTAADALGAARIKTLQFTGSGQNFSVGQNYTPAEPWPPVTVKSYTAAINYDAGSMRVELVREMGAVMPRGGGGPFFGEQRQVQLVSGNYPWNVPGIVAADDLDLTLLATECAPAAQTSEENTSPLQ